VLENWKRRTEVKSKERGRLLSMLALCALTVLSGSRAFADGNAAPGAGSNPPTVTNKSDLNAVRLSVLNAIANYVNKAWEASYRIQWDFLPDSPTLEDLSASVKPVEIVIANADLGNNAWIEHIRDPEKQRALGDLLGLHDKALDQSPGHIKQFDLHDFAIKKGDNAPLPDNYIALAENPALSAEEQIAARLDHFALRAILRSNGIRLKVQISDDVVVQGGNERVLDSEIQWKITLYPIDRGGIRFYRAKVRAELRRPQVFTFPITSTGSKPIKVIAALKSGPTTLGLPAIVTSGDGTVNFPDQSTATPPVTLPATSSSTTIEGILDFVGGVKLDDVVSKALFNPKNPGRLFYGGLIGQGQIKQLVGVNQLFATANSTLAFGLLLGIAPTANNALFVGPSLQMDALTLSVGAMAQERDNGNNSHSIKVEPAVGLSLDLSNLIGGNKNTQTIPLANNVIGGISSDDVARANFAVTTRITPDANLSPDDKKLVLGKMIVLRRVASFDDKGVPVPIPADKQSVLQVVVSETPLYRVLPPGKYQIENGGLPTAFGAFAPASTLPAQFVFIGAQDSQEALSLVFTIKRLPAPTPN